jgi:hypothetical protein
MLMVLQTSCCPKSENSEFPYCDKSALMRPTTGLVLLTPDVCVAYMNIKCLKKINANQQQNSYSSLEAVSGWADFLISSTLSAIIIWLRYIGYTM